MNREPTTTTARTSSTSSSFSKGLEDVEQPFNWEKFGKTVSMAVGILTIMGLILSAIFSLFSFYNDVLNILDRQYNLIIDLTDRQAQIEGKLEAPLLYPEMNSDPADNIKQ